MRQRRHELAIGKKYSRWTVLSFVGFRKSGINNKPYYLCRCECGKEKEVCLWNIKCGFNKSCGCLHTENLFERNRKRRMPIKEAASRNFYRQYKYNCGSRRGLEFGLSLDEFKNLIYQKCSYCGREPSIRLRRRNNKANNSDFFLANGVDRVNNLLGYIKGNVVPCCSFCNMAKFDFSAEEFLSNIQKISDFQKKKSASCDCDYCI